MALTDSAIRAPKPRSAVYKVADDHDLLGKSKIGSWTDDRFCRRRSGHRFCLARHPVYHRSINAQITGNFPRCHLGRHHDRRCAAARLRALPD